MKLNELVCPSCGLKCMVDAAFTTCDGCNTYFHASQSRSRDNPVPLAQPQPHVTITWPPFRIDPNIQIQPVITPWITPNDPGVTGPSIWPSCGGVVSSMESGYLTTGFLHDGCLGSN